MYSERIALMLDLLDRDAQSPQPDRRDLDDAPAGADL
jgi:hypothetical protein